MGDVCEGVVYLDVGPQVVLQPLLMALGHYVDHHSAGNNTDQLQTSTLYLNTKICEKPPINFTGKLKQLNITREKR